MYGILHPSEQILLLITSVVVMACLFIIFFGWTRDDSFPTSKGYRGGFPRKGKVTKIRRLLNVRGEVIFTFHISSKATTRQDELQELADILATEVYDGGFDTPIHHDICKNHDPFVPNVWHGWYIYQAGVIVGKDLEWQQKGCRVFIRGEQLVEGPDYC